MLAIAAGAVICVGSSGARADLRLTITVDGSPTVITSNDPGQSANVVSKQISFGGILQTTIDTTLTNFTGDATGGLLQTQTTNSNLGVGATAHVITVLAEVIDHTANDLTSPLGLFTQPVGPNLTLTHQLATTGDAANRASSTATAMGATTGFVSLLAVSPPNIEMDTDTFTNGAMGYTLVNFTRIVIGAQSSIGTTATTNVTGAPEPATVVSVIAGVPVLLIGRWMKRRRARA